MKTLWTPWRMEHVDGQARQRRFGLADGRVPGTVILIAVHSGMR